jgi:glutaredoxin
MRGVTVFTIIGRPNCKWCDKAKELLLSKSEDFIYVDLGQNIWVAQLMKRAGFTTVPLIFSKSGNLIGGYIALEELFKEGPV